jgi:hypothetical protein
MVAVYARVTNAGGGAATPAQGHVDNETP